MKDPSSLSKPTALQLLADASCLSVANITHVLAVRGATELSTSPCAPLVKATRTCPPSIMVQSPVTQHLTERQLFLVFVKILFRYMDHTKLISLRRRTREIVKECTARHRQEKASMPLQATIEERLRDTIGHLHWARAQECYTVYCLQRGLRMVVEAAPARVAV